MVPYLIGSLVVMALAAIVYVLILIVKSIELVVAAIRTPKDGLLHPAIQNDEEAEPLAVGLHHPNSDLAEQHNKDREAIALREGFNPYLSEGWNDGE